AVFVRLEEGRGDPAHPGHTRHEYDPRTGLVNAAVVTVPGAARADLIAPLLPLIALHEMAHVLGVGHSQDQLSVMYPRLASVGQRLTAEDRRAVRRAAG
ncbi:MAG TPA: matrixin family metalloprotease, partial [Methylomirabilota bacterium]|nr:matrixin family metalloprotease [Methylomirabilota bacterium]